jgi:GNAT superfamily N-acetyltransferase
MKSKPLTSLLQQGFYWDDQLKLGAETSALNSLIWPNYLVLDSDIPEPDLKFKISKEEWLRRFPAWGIRREGSGELVAYINAVQVTAETRLPDSGWRYAIQNGSSTEAPNCLCLLVANIHPDVRGQGFSSLLLERAKQGARELGFDQMIAPVRPTLKHQFPFVSMSEYALKKTPEGSVFDPWIRVHIQAGAVISGICGESTLVRASLAKWREWTGLSLLTSGEQLLPTGLVPLKIDTYRDMGTYCEPGVWVRYFL